ncbi:hypothetical protein N8I74_09370 [Chitiniphilus purpureus]|uniref:Uncharacterized protein n=1 Tax=Chitiniphilus purpureus TaxID=2981137 RepID=A0ABY6DVW6_9NEIS|nr:hypothetical protein [Chitiniphilus sp. CD1]UXY17196.1 hypothetical protein N8I74_09370 [Chitiniphilus sp. CD1]
MCKSLYGWSLALLLAMPGAVAAEDQPAPAPATASAPAEAAPAKPVVPLKRLAAPAGRALAVVSLTFSTPPQASDGYATLVLEGPGGERRLTARARDRVRNFDGQPAGTGVLGELSLPPGDYVLRYVSGSYQPRDKDKRREFWVPLGQRLTLAADEVAYLGNLHVVLDGVPVATFSDQRARDFYALAQEKGITDMSNLQLRLPQSAGLPYPY